MADSMSRKTYGGQIRWLLELIRFTLKSSLSYRTAFLMQAVGMMINNASFLIVWYLFFQLFPDVNGWGYQEMIGLNGFIALEYGLVSAFGHGARRLSRDVMYGQIDKYLVQPRSVLLNTIFSDSSISAFGDMFFGIILLVVYIAMIGFSFAHMFILPVLIVSGTFVFAGFCILTQSVVFWIPNSVELSDTLFELMLGPSLWPVSSFTGTVRMFFTFFVPAIVIGGMPVNVLRSLSLLDMAAILACGIFWLGLATIVFYRGLRRYESGNLVGVR